jgi:hypothetical protein
MNVNIILIWTYLREFGLMKYKITQSRTIELEREKSFVLRYFVEANIQVHTGYEID